MGKRVGKEGVPITEICGPCWGCPRTLGNLKNTGASVPSLHRDPDLSVFGVAGASRPLKSTGEGRGV